MPKYPSREEMDAKARRILLQANLLELKHCSKCSRAIVQSNTSGICNDCRFMAAQRAEAQAAEEEKELAELEEIVGERIRKRLYGGREGGWS